MTLFLKTEIEGLSAELNAFFDGDEGTAFVRQELLADPTIVCLEPSEDRLIAIAPNFEPSTCVDKSCLRELSNSEGISIADGEVVYVPLPRAPGDAPPEQGQVTETSFTIARRFLVNAELVKLDAQKRTVIEYFEALYAVSAPFGDAKLQEDLDSLTESLAAGTLSFEDLCSGIEKSLEADGVDDPLEAIAGYSSQAAYLTKLSKFVQEVPKNALDWIEFNLVLSVIEGCPPPDPQISPPKFVSAFNVAHDRLTGVANYQLTYSARRSLFSVLMHTTGILEKIKSRSELEANDRKIESFLRKHKAALVDAEQQSFLDPYKQDPTKLASFLTQYRLAFETDLPFTRLAHIHAGYQILAGLLTLQGIGEVGGDQIVPFAMMATVFAAPPQLATTQAILSELVEPLIGTMSPLDHVMEYSLTQFLSTCEFVIARMSDFPADV